MTCSINTGHIMTTDWRKSYWLPNETNEEHDDRVMGAEVDARWYFTHATIPQRNRFFETMDYLSPLRGPAAERKRADALRLFRESTKEAAALYEATAEMIMRDGQVSEEMSLRWDALQAVPVSEAAE
jgi:hypothetical protein